LKVLYDNNNVFLKTMDSEQTQTQSRWPRVKNWFGSLGRWTVAATSFVAGVAVTSAVVATTALLSSNSDVSESTQSTSEQTE